MLNKLLSTFVFIILGINTINSNADESNSIPSDPNSIQSLIEKANKGDANAQYMLGDRYYHGKDVKHDHNEAIKWFTKSAQQGRVDAETYIGIIYSEGPTVKDWNEAAKWFLKAAEHGSADAQCKLGNIYFNGRGIPEDHNEGIRWLKKAAERGHMASQLFLAMMYSGLADYPKDYNEAFKWFKRAANQGCISAQLNLAVIYYDGAKYYEGLNVAKDCVEAYKWLLIAGVREGYYEAKLKQDIAAKMMPEQIIEAQKRAKEFVLKKELASDMNCSLND
ncbi:MAG: tetratricopeptide repeat protein [Sedimentisphaerales bacterium]